MNPPAAVTAGVERRPSSSRLGRSTRSGRGRTQSDSSEWPTSSRTPPSSFQGGLRYLETAKYPHELSFKYAESNVVLEIAR